MARSKCTSITSIRNLKSTTEPCSRRWPYRTMIVRASLPEIKSQDLPRFSNDLRRARRRGRSAYLCRAVPGRRRPVTEFPSSVDCQRRHPGLRGEVLLKSLGSQVTPALLLQFHEPDDAGFDDLRLRDQRNVLCFSSYHVLASIPASGKGELWHGFAHRLDARFDGRGVFSQHMQSGPIGDHLDLNRLAERTVMLNYIVHVIKGEIHNGGVIDVDLHNQPMRLPLVGRGADFCRSPELGRNAELRAQR